MTKMTDNEKLLLDTIDDLKSRLDKGKEYDLIRASALIRQLLIDDGTPLIDAVNMNYNKKLLFKTQKRNADIKSNFELDGIKFENVVTVMFAKPKHDNEEYLEYLKRDAFLKYNIIFFADQWFNVLDIIKLCTYIYGGVHTHTGDIKDKKTIFLDWANKTVSYDDGVNCGVSAIKDISLIIIDTLQDLVTEIKNKYGLT